MHQIGKSNISKECYSHCTLFRSFREWVNKLLASCYCDGNFGSEIFPVWEMEIGTLFSPSDKYSTLQPGLHDHFFGTVPVWIWPRCLKFAARHPPFLSCKPCLRGTWTMDRQETRLWVKVTITAMKTHEHDSSGARLRVPTDHDEHH